MISDYLKVSEEAVQLLLAGSLVKILAAGVQQHTHQPESQQVLGGVQEVWCILWKYHAAESEGITLHQGVWRILWKYQTAQSEGITLHQGVKGVWHILWKYHTAQSEISDCITSVNKSQHIILLKELPTHTQQYTPPKGDSAYRLKWSSHTLILHSLSQQTSNT